MGSYGYGYVLERLVEASGTMRALLNARGDASAASLAVSTTTT
jgi:hypothetical protein